MATLEMTFVLSAPARRALRSVVSPDKFEFIAERFFDTIENERYRDFAGYQRRYMAAAENLVADRYLLAEDLPRLKDLCEKFRGDFELKSK